MAQKPVRERLAETLLFLNNIYKPEETPNVNSSEATIILPREDLANIVGTATETVIRLLSEFKTENLIGISGRKIILKDIEGLNKVARLQF